MERQRHMTDQMFLVILFAVFAVCAFSLSMIGANIYSHTASVMNEDYEERIDISYVTEKIRQWDEKDSIEIGSFHGRTALIHTERINGKKYNTYLYQEKGALRELMVKDLEKDLEVEEKYENQKTEIIELLRQKEIEVQDLVIKKDNRFLIELYLDEILETA